MYPMPVSVLLALWRATFERFDDAPLDVDAHLRTQVGIIIEGLRPREPGGRHAE